MTENRPKAAPYGDKGEHFRDKYITPLVLVLCCANFVALASYQSNTLPLQLLAILGLASFFLPGERRPGAYGILALVYLGFTITIDYFYFTESSGFSVTRKALYGFFAGVCLCRVSGKASRPCFVNYLVLGVLLSCVVMAALVVTGVMPMDGLFRSGRFRAFAGHPNIYAVIPAFGLVAAVYTILFGPRTTGSALGRSEHRVVRFLTYLLYSRAILVPGTLACAGALFLASSRTPLFAAGVTCLLLVLVACCKRFGRAKGLGFFLGGVMLFSAAAFASGKIGVPGTDRLYSRIVLALCNPLQDHTFRTRLPGWESAIAGISEKPWLGHGPEQYMRVNRRYIQENYDSYVQRFGKNVVDGDTVLFSHAHNQYLNILVEQGIVGFALMAALGGWPILYCLRRRTSLGQTLPLLLCMAVICVADTPIHGNQAAACPATILWMLFGYFACFTQPNGPTVQAAAHAT